MPGSAVFLTRVKDKTPPVIAWHVRQSRALHENVLALTFTTLSVPWTRAGGAGDVDARGRPLLARGSAGRLHGAPRR